MGVHGDPGGKLVLVTKLDAHQRDVGAEHGQGGADLVVRMLEVVHVREDLAAARGIGRSVHGGRVN